MAGNSLCAGLYGSHADIAQPLCSTISWFHGLKESCEVGEAEVRLILLLSINRIIRCCISIFFD